jgi:voltage-gated potassium channel
MRKNAMRDAIKKSVDLLYTGRSRRAVQFRYGLIGFDAATILFFIATAATDQSQPVALANMLIGILILCDFSARFWIAKDRWEMLRRVYTIADLVVILSLLAAPFLSQNLALLRVLRGLRLIHSYHLVRDLRRENKFFRMHEDAIYAALNLFVFIFVTTSIVFVMRVGNEANLSNYIDALYFTVATLTTTGFGDITMTTPTGKLLSVFIMVFGVALFVKLAQAIFQPSRIKYRCTTCGLSKHEQDAVHCKHCGEQLNIEKDGTD